MRPLNLNIQHRLMEIPLPPSLLQHLHLLVLQPPPRLLFQFFPTNLRPHFLGFLVFVLRFKPRLHPQADFRRGSDLVGVAADGRWGCAGVDAEVGVAHGAEVEEAGLGWGGVDLEGFFGGDGFAGC